MSSPGGNLLPKPSIRSYVQQTENIGGGVGGEGGKFQSSIASASNVSTARAPQLYHSPDEPSAHGVGTGGQASGREGVYPPPPQAPQQYHPEQEQMKFYHDHFNPDQGAVAPMKGGGRGGNAAADRAAPFRHSTNPQALSLAAPHGEPAAVTTASTTTLLSSPEAAAAAAAAAGTPGIEAGSREQQPQSKDGQGPQGLVENHSEVQVPVVYQPATPMMSPLMAHPTFPLHTQTYPPPQTQPMSPWLFQHQPPPQSWQSPAPTFAQPYYGSPMMMSPPPLYSQIQKPLPGLPPRHDGTGTGGVGAAGGGPGPGLVVHFKCRECGGPLESEFAPCRKMHMQMTRPDLQAQPELLQHPQYLQQSNPYPMMAAPPAPLSTVSGDVESNYGTNDIYLRHRQNRWEERPPQPSTTIYYANAPAPASGPALVDSRLNHNNINNNSFNQYNYAPAPTVITSQVPQTNSTDSPMVSGLKRFWKDVRDEVNYQTGGTPAQNYHQVQQPAQVTQVQYPTQFGQPAPYPGYPPYQ